MCLKPQVCRLPAVLLKKLLAGPTLGQEAINNGIMSFIIAFILILIYMVFYYNTAGMVADLAMFANLFFVFGILASLGAVLTLPGIAGIVLVIGMSVDANVLIYERIREELREGKGLRLAITDGYKHAMSSILDSNITTLTGCYYPLDIFGTGPIQGFATTLIIGILSSLFSAIFISRLIFEWLLGKNKINPFFYTDDRTYFERTKKFTGVGKRKLYYAFSGAIIIAGCISFFTQGFTLGVDFKGGM